MYIASRKFDKGSKEWMLFQDYWKLCQKYWEPEQKDEYWKELLDDVRKFWDTYQDSVFAKEIAMAFVLSLEERKENTITNGNVETRGQYTIDRDGVQVLVDKLNMEDA